MSDDLLTFGVLFLFCQGENGVEGGEKQNRTDLDRQIQFMSGGPTASQL